MGDLWDLELIDVGEGTVIGTNAMITAHHIRRGKLFRKRIKIVPLVQCQLFYQER